MTVDKFQLPPYPHDKLRRITLSAKEQGRKVVDLSIGTPCDPPSDQVTKALLTPNVINGYPPSIGTSDLRNAARQMLERRFSVRVEESELAMCVGTKEFVASLPHFLHLKNPGKDTVLYPAVSYPTYAMGAHTFGLRAVPVPPGVSGSMDFSAIGKEDLDRALLLWVNTPANPTGETEDLLAAAKFAADYGITLCSDECYGEFTSPLERKSVLSCGKDNILALHSLSKRSNAAGLRVGFYAGDGELVHFLQEIRKHLGLMIPGPIQAAGVEAFAEDEAVDRQWGIYKDRLSYLIDMLNGIGVKATMPKGGFYLWVKSPESYQKDPRLIKNGGKTENSGWLFTEDLAKYGAMLVSPGDFYGQLGADHIRIAAVQPLEKLELIKSELEKSKLSFL